MRAIFLAVAVLVMSGCGPERVPPDGPGYVAPDGGVDTSKPYCLSETALCRPLPSGPYCGPCPYGCVDPDPMTGAAACHYPAP